MPIIDLGQMVRSLASSANVGKIEVKEVDYLASFFYGNFERKNVL